VAGKIWIVLPGYNVGRHLEVLVPAIRAHAPSDAVICLVDDGSTDDTAARAQALGIELRTHVANQGKGRALKTGFEAALEADAAAVITMDADGQHRPEELGRFVEAWQADWPVVIGNRMDANQNMPWLRKRTNEFTSSVISRLAHARIRDSQNGYRLFDARVLRDIKLESRRYDMESEILIKAGALGYRIGAVPVSTVYRDEESSIHPFIDTLRFIRLVWRSQRWRRSPRR
jgi:glycosyltransferase involved in cell wall biosynthesis